MSSNFILKKKNNTFFLTKKNNVPLKKFKLYFNRKKAKYDVTGGHKMGVKRVKSHITHKSSFWCGIDIYWKYTKTLIPLKMDIRPIKKDELFFKHLTLLWTSIACILPENREIRDIYNLFVNKYRQTNHFKHYRFFMGFPTNGQRTWSNAMSSRKRYNSIRVWEEAISQQKFSFVCPPDTIRRLCHMEILNKIWHTQWHHEWVCARNHRLRYERRFKYKSWRLSFEFAVRNKALAHYKNPLKKIKKNKRKVVMPLNKINVGLPYNFGVIYTRRIFSTSTWKKKKSKVY